jgi:hypothetical protein
MLAAYLVLKVIYWLIYLWVVVVCFWNLFVEKQLYRQISFVLITVPFVLRLLGIK